MSKTALFDAAKRWDARSVRTLLAASPDLIRARDPRGRTALHLCAATPLPSGDGNAQASVATARALLGGGADLNETHQIPDDKEVFRASPLWYALARGRNPTLARFFLKEGADLIYAARLAREQPLLALVAAGADTAVKDAKGRTAMDHARKKRLSPAVLAALTGR